MSRHADHGGRRLGREVERDALGELREAHARLRAERRRAGLAREIAGAREDRVEARDLRRRVRQGDERQRGHGHEDEETGTAEATDHAPRSVAERGGSGRGGGGARYSACVNVKG